MIASAELRASSRDGAMVSGRRRSAKAEAARSRSFGKSPPDRKIPRRSGTSGFYRAPERNSNVPSGQGAAREEEKAVPKGRIGPARRRER